MWHRRIRSAIGWALSIGCHLGSLVYWAGVETGAPIRAQRAEISFSVVQPPTHSPQQATESLPPSSSRPSAGANRVTRPRNAPPPTDNKASTPTPVDLTGVTLTGGNGASWSSQVGDGSAMTAPIVAPSAKTLGLPQPTQKEQLPSGRRQEVSALVSVAELGEKPLPPRLDGALLENYPPEARRQGIAGRAQVVARIEPDGTVRKTSTISESAAGFGQACERTLQSSKWSAPRDRDGRAVPTQIRYTCDFRVDG